MADYTNTDQSGTINPVPRSLTPIARSGKLSGLKAGVSRAALPSPPSNIPPDAFLAGESMASRAPAPVAAASEPAAALPTDPPVTDLIAEVVATPDATQACEAGAPQLHSFQQETTEIVMTTTEDFVNQGQANVEAVIKAGQIWATGFQDLGRSLAETAKEHYEHNIATWKALSGTKSIKEAFDIQSTRARAAMEKAVADTGKLTDASMKLAEQAMAPITARLTVATEKFARVN